MLSVILPAYNEAKAIGASLASLSRYLDGQAGSPGRWKEWEILVVDDGSVDATAQTAAAAAGRDGRIHVIELTPHRGKGAAVREGLSRAVGTHLIVTDVDLSYALEDLGRAYEALAAGADLVAGDRRHGDSRIDRALAARSHAARRQALSTAFNLLVRWLYRIPWRDTQCGLKGLRREAAHRISPRMITPGFLSDIEMLLIARGHGLRVEPIPVHLTYLSADSTVRVLNQAPSVLADALRIKCAQVRGRYGPS